MHHDKEQILKCEMQEFVAKIIKKKKKEFVAKALDRKS